MEVSQIYQLVNSVTTEVLGSAALQREDLTDVVDVGTQLFDAGAIDNYVKSLVNHIGRVVFVNRPYEGSAPSVLMDAWEYGSVMEKITAALPTASENQSWELVDGQTYDPNIFTKPNVSAKFFNSRTTFEIPMSFTERQVRESFSSAQQLNAFISMIETAIYKSLTVKTDALIMRTINNMTALTLANAFPPSGADYSESAGNARAVNLLYLYNQMYPDAKITDAAVAIKTSRFVRFAAYTMKLYMERMRKVSTLFNMGGTDKFTPESLLHIVMLSDFAAAADVYEQSDTFHDTFTALPNAERVPYWQGSGTGYDFQSVSSINVTASNGQENGVDVTASGILAVMFDRDALGVCNWDRRVTTNYNPRAEFYNNWYKQDCMYFCDGNEPYVVFYAADTSE
jgi:hypothetical protein